MGRNDIIKKDGSIDYDYLGNSIDNLNNAVKDLGSQTADLVYETAGGTATAITLTTGALVDGYAKTFIASANNNSAVTTINGKKLYKPNTTTAPTLTVGKAYTVWYNASGDCFFIKASAEGNAVPSHVLAGDRFSNDNDTGLVGTMDLSNLVSGNIKEGVNINGIVGNLTIENLGGKRFASGTLSEDHVNSTVSIQLPFTPSIFAIGATSSYYGIKTPSWENYNSITIQIFTNSVTVGGYARQGMTWYAIG